MKRLRGGISVFVIGLCLVPIQNAFAEFYRYLDDNGTVCFVDRIQAIPEKYRKEAVTVDVGTDASFREGRSEFKKGSETQRREAVSPAEKLKSARDVFERPWLRWFVGIVGFLFIYSLIGRLSSFLDHKQIGSFLRILFTVGVMAFLLHSYAKEVVNVFALLKEELIGVKDRVEETNQVTGDLLKQLPESQKH